MDTAPRPKVLPPLTPDQKVICIDRPRELPDRIHVAGRGRLQFTVDRAGGAGA